MSAIEKAAYAKANAALAVLAYQTEALMLSGIDALVADFNPVRQYAMGITENQQMLDFSGRGNHMHLGPANYVNNYESVWTSQGLVHLTHANCFEWSDSAALQSDAWTIMSVHALLDDASRSREIVDWGSPAIFSTYTNMSQGLNMMGGGANYVIFPTPAREIGKFNCLTMTMPGIAQGQSTNSKMYFNSIDETPTTVNDGGPQGAKTTCRVGTASQSCLARQLHFNRVLTPSEIANNLTLINKSMSDFVVPRYAFKKVIFAGDSITAGYSLPDSSTRYDRIVQERLLFGWIYNEGYSGSYLCNQASGYDLVNHWNLMAADADVISVYIGLNDWGSGTATMGAAGSTNPAEFNGALNVVMNGLQAKYTGKPIVFVTPPRCWCGGNNADHVNPNSGVALVGYRDAIIARAAAHSIPVLDLYSDAELNGSDNPAINTALYSDGTHLNEAGHAVIGRKIADFLLTL